jgi:hypothetical protein
MSDGSSTKKAGAASNENISVKVSAKISFAKRRKEIPIQLKKSQKNTRPITRKEVNTSKLTAKVKKYQSINQSIKRSTI